MQTPTYKYLVVWKKKNNNNNNHLTVLSTYWINGRRLENGSGRRTDICGPDCNLDSGQKSPRASKHYTQTYTETDKQKQHNTVIVVNRSIG